ncbi:MAG: exopolysaccharide biosynthesis polyprenyl glycosylphosphotransferase [Planctomycetota bacterium]
MLSSRAESSRITLFVLDQALLAAAYAGAYLIKRTLLPGGETLDAAGHVSLYLLAAPFIAIGLWASGLYRLGLEPVWPALSGARETLWGAFVAMAVLALVDGVRGLWSAAGPVAGQAVPFLFLGSAAAALWASRLLLERAVHRISSDERIAPRLLVFGMSQRLLRLLATLQRSSRSGPRVIGVAADTVPVDIGPRLTTDQAMELLVQGRVDHVLVEAEAVGAEQLEQVLAQADVEGISVHVTSAIFPSTNLVPTWERVGGVPLLGFVSAELPLGARLVKRTFDISVSALLIGLCAVPMALIALAITTGTRGPAFYRQRRVGTRGREFTMLKFRTMRPDAEAGGPAFAVANDPRCTRIGFWLRRRNLDELPQLFNVLLGHMSLVGPRPERPEFVTDFKQRIARYAHKHWVKPGITGWAQIHGLRGANTDLQDRIDHDLYYIENWSLMLDIRILVRTIFDGYLNAA